MKSIPSIDHSRHQDKKKTNHVHIYTLLRTCECCNPSNSVVPVAKSFCFQKEIKSIVMPTFKTHCFSGAHATEDNLIDSVVVFYLKGSIQMTLLIHCFERYFSC